MPKKLGTCPQAAASREREAIKKKADKEQKEREKEDELWKEDDKLVTKKLQRKDEKVDKRQELLAKKLELKKLFEEEVASTKSSKASQGKPQPSKLTQAQVAAARENVAAQLSSLNKKTEKQQTEELESNPNRVQCEGVEARSVSEAIAVLNVNESEAPGGEAHPERRRKAAHVAYEERMLPIFRAQYPSLRAAQLKQMIFKEFQKSPENPMNQTGDA